MKQKRSWRRFFLGMLIALGVDLVGAVVLLLTTWYVGAIIWVMACLAATGIPLVDDDWVLPAGFWTFQVIAWMAWLAGFWSLVSILSRTLLQQPPGGS